MNKILIVMSFLGALSTQAYDSETSIHCFGNWTEAHYQSVHSSGGYNGSSLSVKYKDFSAIDQNPEVRNLRGGLFISSSHGFLKNVHEVCQTTTEEPKTHYAAELGIKFNNGNTLSSDVLCTCEYSRSSH